jgi:hypothetical protein
VSDHNEPSRAAPHRAMNSSGETPSRLNQLCAVIALPDYGLRKRFCFIGWTDSPTSDPIVIDSLNDLSPNANQSFRLYQESKHTIPQINAEIIIPIEYQAPDEMKDYPDDRTVRSFDLFCYYVRDVMNGLSDLAYIDETAKL